MPKLTTTEYTTLVTGANRCSIPPITPVALANWCNRVFFKRKIKRYYIGWGI